MIDWLTSIQTFFIVFTEQTHEKMPSKKGRKPKLSNEQVQIAKEMYNKGYPIRKIAERFNVSRMCVWRSLKKEIVPVTNL